MFLSALKYKDMYDRVAVTHPWMHKMWDEIEDDLSYYMLVPTDKNGIPIKVNDHVRVNGDTSVDRVIAVGCDFWIGEKSPDKRDPKRTTHV